MRRPWSGRRRCSIASRCGSGSRPSRSSSGAHSWCSAAKGSSISDSTPVASEQPEPRCCTLEMLQQRALADPRLTADHEHPTLSVADGVEQVLEFASLFRTPDQVRGRRGRPEMGATVDRGTVTLRRGARQGKPNSSPAIDIRTHVCIASTVPWSSLHCPGVTPVAGAHLEQLGARARPLVLAHDRGFELTGGLGALVPGATLARDSVIRVGGGGVDRRRLRARRRGHRRG